MCTFLCLASGLITIPSVAQEQATAARTQLQEMQTVEDAWSAAINKRDQFALENALSPALVDIAATGDVTTRNQDIAKLFSKDALPLSMTQKVITVRTLNDGFVLVNGTYTLRWMEPSGSSAQGVVDEKGIFTHVFQSVNGHWLCVNSQRTVVAEQTPPVKTKATAPKAKSNAAEPFHIPLIHKGAQSTQPATVPSPPPS